MLREDRQRVTPLNTSKFDAVLIGQFAIALTLMFISLWGCERDESARSIGSRDSSSGVESNDLDTGRSSMRDALLDGAIRGGDEVDQGAMDADLDGGSPSVDPPVELSDRAGTFKVYITLDDEPSPGSLLVQGGSALRWTLDEDGVVEVTVDRDVLGPIILFASHPLARTKGRTVEPDRRASLLIELIRFETPDQPDAPFSDPGEPRRRASTTQCGHCHNTNNDTWYDSPHRSSAKNPIVYDLYTGRGGGYRERSDCEEAGGRWVLGQTEGGGAPRQQCYFDISALGAYNESCATPPCDSSALRGQPGAYFGGCADCHAPAVDGLTAGGHDLLSVSGKAFDYGVSCDLCHHVERVDLEEPAGVGGRLKLHRPREGASVTLGGGGYLPLSFGPSPDVSNPRMGISPRDHYRDGTLCGGCHQHDHSDEHTRAPLNPTRWPNGTLPNQSTFKEWKEGPLGEVAPCNSCHMPPMSALMNSANLERFSSADIGVQGGWPRPADQTRQHSWWGPRQPEGKMLEMAASLSIEGRLISLPEPASTGEMAPPSIDPLTSIWQIRVEVENVGAGHGLPTGEPMRHLILLVGLSCGGEPIEAVAGDAVHELGGALETRGLEALEEPWLRAEVGDRLRLVYRADEVYDYDGYTPFSQGESGRFTPRERGLWRDDVVGEAEVTSVSEAQNISLSADLLALRDRFETLRAQFLTLSNEGTLDRLASISGESQRSDAGYSLYLIRAQDATGSGYAGRSGFTFARVMRDATGREMAPHFVAIDVVRDNRLKPDTPWRTEHYFSAECDAPEATAELIYRPYPLWLSRERRWTLWDQQMSRVSVILSSREEEVNP